MKIKYPNYQNSILSLASSVLKHYGTQTNHTTLDCSPSTQHDTFKAAHTGLTEDEMNIPFISIDCM